MEYIKKTGLLFFTVGIMALAVWQMFYAELQPVFISDKPGWVPGYTFWAYVGNLILIIGCAAIIFKKREKLAAILLAALILLLFIVNHFPYQAINNPTNPGAWTSALKGLAISGGFFIIAGLVPGKQSEGENAIVRILYKMIPAGKVFFSITMVLFGIDHFLYVDFVASLVPNWIPGHIFWTYFAGVALIGSGLAIIFNIKMRLAAALLGTMIFIWFAILHIPRAVADPYSGNGNELRSVFEALAFSGIGFILAVGPQRKRD